MRSFTTEGAPGRCPRCLIVQQWCVCAEVPTVETKTRVVVVRHQREGWKSTNTARIAALALPRLELLDYGDDFEPALSALPGVVSGAHLLFPSDEAAPVQLADVKTLIVIDGTWRQTRKMLNRLPMLGPLPRVSLPAQTQKVLRLRESTFEEGRSTLEAIAEALALIEGPNVAAPLHALHAKYVEQVFRARGVWDQKRREHA
ncbi:MAG: tRNA-uridine aminocarboxypropyltransferase [Myxococcaceae bacterium]